MHNMSKILITGATGRVGANLIKSLNGKGADVRAFVMKNDPQRKKLDKLDCEVFEGSLCDSDDLEKAVSGCDIVVHLAALIVRPTGMSERAFWDINVNATFDLIRISAHNKVKRFVLASTDATYTACNPRYSPIDEHHVLNPYTVYGLTKKVCEDMAFEALAECGLPVTITRFAYVMACDEVLGYFRIGSVADALKGSPPAAMAYVPGIEKPWLALNMTDPDELVVPKGEDLLPWRIHVADVRDIVSGVLLAMERDEAVGEAFNLAGPYSATWEKAIRCIAEKTGRTWRECVIPNYWGYEIDISKAKRLLGYAPEYDIARMINDAFTFRDGADIGVIPAII